MQKQVIWKSLQEGQGTLYANNAMAAEPGRALANAGRLLSGL